MVPISSMVTLKMHEISDDGRHIWNKEVDEFEEIAKSFCEDKREPGGDIRRVSKKSRQDHLESLV